MKPALLFIAMFCLPGFMFAQQDTTNTKKKGNFGQTIQKIPDMLIAAPDKAADSSMYFLKNDNLVMTVPPLWQEKGMQTNNDLKIDKINDDPLDVTFPVPEKKLANGLIITMATIKKSADDKKQLILSLTKTHLAALFKDQQKPITTDKINEIVTGNIGAPEDFTTRDGRKGELYFVNDFQPQQSGFLVIWLTPGLKPGTTIIVQFNYYHYNYDAMPDDLNDLKVFEFPDDQKAYMDFSEKMLKSFIIE